MNFVAVELSVKTKVPQRVMVPLEMCAKCEVPQ